MLIEIVSVLCGLVLVFYIYMSSNNTKWEKEDVPHKKPTFFFGNFKDAILGKKNFGIVFKEIYDEFPDAPIVGMHVLRNTSIMLKDPDIIKQVLVSNFQSFMDNDFEVNLKEDKIWASNPFSNKGEKWKAVRARWVPHLTQVKLKATYKAFQKKTDELVKKLNAEIETNPKKEFILKHLVSNFFLDYVIYGIFGIEIDSFEQSDNLFKQVKNRIFQSNFLDALIVNSFVIAPWLGNFISTRMVSKEQEDKLLTVAREIMSLRRESGQPNTDIYETLQKYSEQDGKSTFSDYDLAGRIFGVMLDGSETTANPITMGLYELACNPDVQERLRSEINNAVQEGGGEISFDEIHKLPYLEQVFCETLRLYVPLSHLSKLCTKDTTIEYKGRAIKVKEGEVVVIPTYALHTDAHYHRDPYKFDPERFSEEARNDMPKCAYMPFGEGPRICSGMKLGILESKMLLATMVRNFHLIPSMEVPRPIPMDPKVFVYRSTDDLKITLRPIIYARTD